MVTLPPLSQEGAEAVTLTVSTQASLPKICWDSSSSSLAQERKASFVGDFL